MSLERNFSKVSFSNLLSRKRLNERETKDEKAQILAKDKELDFIPIPTMSDYHQLFEKNENCFQRAGIFSDNSIHTAPWFKEEFKSKTSINKLNSEIFSFYEFIKPTSQEDIIKEEAYAYLKNLVLLNYPCFSVSLFGSFATGLHLPTSDIDISITQNSDQDPINDIKMLNSIANLLSHDIKYSEIEVVHSRVPLIRTIFQSKVRIDITVNRSNGSQAKDWIIQVLNKAPHFRILILLLKYFLKQRDLNNAYTGGLSSYVLFNMVYVFINFFNKNVKSSQTTLAHLLLSFLKFYGTTINYSKVGISIIEGGCFFNKSKSECLSKNQNALYVTNQLESKENMAAAAFRYSSIISLFKASYNYLVWCDKSVDSILKGIIFTDNFIEERAKSKK